MTPLTRRSFLGLTVALPLLPSALQAAGHAVTHEVSIEGMAFSPATLEVKIGDTIVFTNKDRAPHTASAVDESFDSGRLSKGESFELVIESTGQIDYFCKFHRTMKASFTAS